MYEISELTGNIYFNGVLVPQDDTNPMWQAYWQHKQNGGEIVFVEATDEEIAEQQIQLAKSNETEAYKKRAQDGINAYAEISAEFRLAKLSGIISEETQRHVERALTPVRNEILAGQWISAKNELELLGSDSIGVDLYNRLHNQITNYINENY